VEPNAAELMRVMHLIIIRNINRKINMADGKEANENNKESDKRVTEENTKNI
jgi:hypothetical protein